MGVEFGLLGRQIRTLRWSRIAGEVVELSMTLGGRDGRALLVELQALTLSFESWNGKALINTWIRALVI